MNRETVRRASAGLAAWVREHGGTSIVVGFDARHHSAQFARDAAEVFAGAGLRGLLIGRTTPTPVLAFAVRELGCDAGVMVTASHNPAADNGYKVYAADGAQIVPPVDAEISALIDAAPADGELPRGEPEPADPGIVERYLSAIVPAALAHAPTQRDVRIVYTPVHGVGRDVMLDALARAGFSAPHVVAAQAEPDPDFPTAPRPNPEERGVLDMALGDARATGADIVLANDPDADRLAVAVPWSGHEAHDGWRRLTGDEVGALLADELLRSTADRSQRRLVITTVVSSTLLARQAQAAGARSAVTLTGFKWIMHAAARAAPAQFLFGYEQALGYGVTDLVRDKDGISAGLAVAAIAARARNEDSTLQARLDALARRFGLHATAERDLPLRDAGAGDRAERALAALRDDPPARLIGEALTAVDDLQTGLRRGSDGRARPLGLPSSSGIILHAGEAVRLAIRPSGTEPKMKVYLQIVVPVASDDVDDARREGGDRLQRLAAQAQELMAP